MGKMLKSAKKWWKANKKAKNITNETEISVLITLLLESENQNHIFWRWEPLIDTIFNWFQCYNCGGKLYINH